MKFNVAKKLKSSSGVVADARINAREASRIATARSMSNKRLVSIVLALLLGLFLAYTSFFYFPAYTSGPKIIEITTEQGGIPHIEPRKSHGLEPYLNHLLMQRGYMKAGQTVSMSYKLSEGTKLDIAISKCAGPVIIEVYSCRGSIVDVLEIGDRLEGMIDLTVQSNGFYHFTRQVLETSENAGDFQLVWKRL